MKAVEKFNQRADAAQSFLCVGLDSDFDRIPASFRHDTHPQFAFNRWLIEQTHPYTAAYKLNTAFYEARAEKGWYELKVTVEYLRLNHPDILTICDAKRGDIDSTSRAYAKAILDDLGFDCVTLHPYLGRDALEPFLSRADKGAIILCRTSNPGAGELQNIKVDGKPLWAVVAETVSRDWNGNGNCMLVVGATYPDEMRQVRAIVGDMTLLVPGIGAQGGDLAAVVAAGLNPSGKGLIINVSRAIIFADHPAEAAQMFRDQINNAVQRVAG